MFCGRFLEILKARFCPEKAINLSALINPSRLKTAAFYMRPCNDEQSSQMFEAYFLATRADWERGGHIFVSSARAPDVLRLLRRQWIAPVIHNWSAMNDLSPFFSLLEQTDSVNVYVEDDAAPFKERSERFQAVQDIVRKQSDEVFEYISDGTPVKLARPAQSRIPVMFVELNLQTKRGFSVFVAQLKKEVTFCFISRKNAHDYVVRHELVGEPCFDDDEHKSLEANTFKIYGSGNKHHGEMCSWHDRSLQYTVPTDVRSHYEIRKRKATIDVNGLYEESNLGLAFDGEGIAILVNLSR